jgi:hypothetical protein
MVANDLEITAVNPIHCTLCNVRFQLRRGDGRRAAQSWRRRSAWLHDEATGMLVERHVHLCGECVSYFVDETRLESYLAARLAERRSDADVADAAETARYLPLADESGQHRPAPTRDDRKAAA